MADLSEPILKLNRAAFHLTSLGDDLKRFAASKPFTFSIKQDPHSSVQEVWAKPARALPTKQWGVIVGDIVYNARSALDLLVGQVCTLPIEHQGRRRLQFPICDSLENYRSEEERGRLIQVPDSKKEVIKWSQPWNTCNGTVGNGLRILREMNNADKHRLIPVVRAISTIDTLQSDKGAFAGIEMSSDAHVEVERAGEVSSFEGVGDGVLSEDPTLIAKVRIAPGTMAQIQPRIFTVIQFGKGDSVYENQDVTPTLALVVESVETIIRRFQTATAR